MKQTLLLIITLFSVFVTKAQDSSFQKIRITQDERLILLENKKETINQFSPKETNTKKTAKTSKNSRGYRVQIYSGNDRAEVTKIRNLFKTSYPQYTAYIDFVAPNYKIRVGNYSSSEEAASHVKYLKRVYPSARVVSAYIN